MFNWALKLMCNSKTCMSIWMKKLNIAIFALRDSYSDSKLKLRRKMFM